MCSIIGYKGKYDEKLLTKVFDNSQIRGVHSFGFAYEKEGNMTVHKFLSYNTFLKTINSIKPDKFIAHFRYSTSGDYHNQNNNQPLLQNNITIAFNGVISQKTKEGMESEFGLKLLADNDGYVLLNKFTDKNWIKSDKITFAMVGLVNGKLIAIKNKKRPLWVKEGPEQILLTSTKDIMERSGVNNSTQLKNLELYEW